MSRDTKTLSEAVNGLGGQLAPVCFGKAKDDELHFQLKMKSGTGKTSYGSYEAFAEMYSDEFVAKAKKLLKEAKDLYDTGVRFGSTKGTFGVGEYLPKGAKAAKPGVPAVAGEACNLEMTTAEISKLVAKGVPADVVAAMVNLRGFAG